MAGLFSVELFHDNDLQELRPEIGSTIAYLAILV